MTANNEEGPAVQSEAFENTSTPSEEQEMNDTIIAETSDNCEAVRPIYGESDPRWAELVDVLESDADRFVVTMDELEPNERARWHALHVLGRDPREVAFADIVYPDFPEGIQAPAFAEDEEDSGVQLLTDRPTRLYFRELPTVDGVAASLGQEFAFDPEANEIVRDEAYLSVWVDGNTQLRYADPSEALRVARALLQGAARLRDVLDGAASA